MTDWGARLDELSAYVDRLAAVVLGVVEGPVPPHPVDLTGLPAVHLPRALALVDRVRAVERLAAQRLSAQRAYNATA